MSAITTLDQEYGFCRHGHLKKCSPDLIFGTPPMCKCGEPISIFISENEMQKKLKQLREVDKTKSYKTISDLKIKFQEVKVGGKNVKLIVYALNKLGCNYELPPNVKDFLPHKKIKDEDAIEAKKIDIPHEAYYIFCKHGHLTKTHYVEKGSLFSIDDITHQCECGETLMFCISKSEVSRMLGGVKNLRNIKMGTFGGIAVYNTYRLGCRNGILQEA